MDDDPVPEGVCDDDPVREGVFEAVGVFVNVGVTDGVAQYVAEATA